MSDPVTNVDIEDVLASIRRLVLQGPSSPAEAPVAAARGRLVLTQALRVEEPEARDSADDGREGPVLDLDDHRNDRQGDGLARSPIEPVLRLDDSLAVRGDAPDAVESSAAVLVLSAPMAVPEPAGPEPTSPERPLPPRATDLRGIEAALSDAPGGWDPDGSEEELDWSLGSVAEAAPAPVFRHRAPGAQPIPGARAEAPVAGPPAALPDDAHLRALITEVLRAELQGELGERMTRNIRKLVRREIFRVLETRDDG